MCASALKELARSLELICEVNGGGASLKSFWRDNLAADATLDQVREHAEGSVRNCYHSAIRKRITRLDEVRSLSPILHTGSELFRSGPQTFSRVLRDMCRSCSMFCGRGVCRPEPSGHLKFIVPPPLPPPGACCTSATLSNGIRVRWAFKISRGRFPNTLE